MAVNQEPELAADLFYIEHGKKNDSGHTESGMGFWSVVR